MTGRSRTSKNRLAEQLARTGRTVEALADETGIDLSRLRALAEDPRQIPEPAEFQGLCLSLGLQVEGMVAFDPEPVSPAGLIGAGGPLEVAICGAGNLGHVFTGLLSRRSDVRVRLCPSTPERARFLKEAIARNGGIEVKSRDGSVRGTPALVSSDPAEAIRGAHLVLLCLPSHCEPAVLEKIAPHVEPGAFVGAVPGPGGFHWAATRALERAGRRATVFGLASIPWMCKLDRQGDSVRVLGRKTITGIAALPAAGAGRAADLMSALLGIPVVDVRSFLQVILNPGNQLLHPAILYDQFRDWDGTPLAEPPLFYETVSERAAELLEAMSGELQQLREQVETRRPNRPLSAVLPIQLAIYAAYGADIRDPSTLRSTIATNRSYAGIRTPMNKVENGFLPNWESRFLHEDIPFGLVVVKGIAERLGVATPAIDEVTRWAQERMGKQYLVGDALRGPDVPGSGAPQRYAIELEQLLD